MDSLDDILRHPAVAGSVADILSVWEAFRRDRIPTLRCDIQQVIDFIASRPAALTPGEMTALFPLILKINHRVNPVSSRIHNDLEMIRQHPILAGSAKLREEVERLQFFMGHDSEHLFPHTGLIEPSLSHHPEWNPAYLRTATAMLRMIFAPAHVETLVQVFTFPVGIIYDLCRTARREAMSEGEMNLTALMRVTTGIAVFRMVIVSGLPRVTWFDAVDPSATPPDLVVCTADTAAGALLDEGIYVIGPADAALWGPPYLLTAIAYGTVKNAMQALRRQYKAAWAKRPDPLHLGARLFLRTDVSSELGGVRLNNGYWVTVLDSAGGYPHQSLLLRAIEIAADVMKTLAPGTEALSLQLQQRSARERQQLITALSRQLYLRRGLAERLFNALIIPGSLSECRLGEIMELAGILWLSGQSEPSETHSGFGLHALEQLAPSAGVVYAPQFVRTALGPGTRTVMAVQGRGLRESAQHLREVAATVFSHATQTPPD